MTERGGKSCDFWQAYEQVLLTLRPGAAYGASGPCGCGLFPAGDTEPVPDGHKRYKPGLCGGRRTDAAL